MIVFKTTRHMVLLDRKNNKHYSFGDKKVLSQHLGLSDNAVADWFRPENGIKPTIKRYKDYEIIDLEGHYKNKRDEG